MHVLVYTCQNATLEITCHGSYHNWPKCLKVHTKYQRQWPNGPEKILKVSTERAVARNLVFRVSDKVRLKPGASFINKVP